MRSTSIIDDDGALTRSGTADPVPWWSFGKMALAIAALRLVQAGRLHLDDRVGAEPFSLRQLLQHRSGLPDYGAIPRYHADVAAGRPPWPVERLLVAADAGRLRFPPGQDWAYSNIGYLTVARLISAASALPLGAALDRLVFQPAGLVGPRLATCPADLDGVRMGGASGYHPGWVFHGLLVGTTTDAARLLRSLLGGHLLTAALLTEMTTPHPLPGHRSHRHPNPAYGLGLMLAASDPAVHPLGHGGEGPGSRIAVYARGGRTVAVWGALPGIDAEALALDLL